MNARDQELFLEMLLKLDGTHESIKAASKWCRANAKYHENVVTMWFFAVAKARTMVRRLDLFHLASDILFTADSVDSMQFYSSFLPQLVRAVPLARGEEIMLNMKKLFLLWREKSIYNKVVMDRLDKLLKNRNKVVDMSIFKYNRALLFENLDRVKVINPVCEYLMKDLEHAPSYENSPAMLSAIKDRQDCQSLLGVVEFHEQRMSTLVRFLEEMVHLLKMSTASLDIAANREQNAVEETKMKILVYGRFGDKVLSQLHMLESNYSIPRKSDDPSLNSSSDLSLFSRRTNVNNLMGPVAQPFHPVNNWTPPNRNDSTEYDDSKAYNRNDSTSNNTMFQRRPYYTNTPQSKAPTPSAWEMLQTIQDQWYSRSQSNPRGGFPHSSFRGRGYSNNWKRRDSM